MSDLAEWVELRLHPLARLFPLVCVSALACAGCKQPDRDVQNLIAVANGQETSKSTTIPESATHFMLGKDQEELARTLKEAGFKVNLVPKPDPANPVPPSGLLKAIKITRNSIFVQRELRISTSSRNGAIDVVTAQVFLTGL